MSLELHAPGSKSMSQRALMIAALADGPSTIRRALDCDDSRRLGGLLSALGVGVDWTDEGAQVVPAPLVSSDARVDCGNAGTAARFGACLALVCEGSLFLDGSARMRERPIGALGDALRSLGVKVEYLEAAGCLPLRLHRVSAPPAEASVDATLSSQFASGLLLVAPRLEKGLRLRLDGASVSRPYLEMTTTMMLRAGARVEWLDPRTILVGPGRYRSDRLAAGTEVEVDWSSAAFLLAGAALTGMEVHVPGLAAPGVSLQGDAAFAGFLEELERPREHRFDLSATPDLIAPLAAAAVLNPWRTRIRGAAHTRVKECDRVAVLARELRKLGAAVAEHADGLDLAPLATLPAGAVDLDPAEDHRMAMAFGVLSLRIPGVRVLQPECVGKSFPGFWAQVWRIRAAQRGFGPVLVGPRGAGKSTLAPLLAGLLELDWLDADAELERRVGRTCTEIFQEEGEAGFRRRERELLLELLDRPGLVLATGGGAVLHEAVREVLRRRMTVWLHAPARVLAARIRGTGRPSLTGGLPDEELGSLLEAREPLYKQVATMEVDTSGLGPTDIARSIAGSWSRRRGGG